MNTFIPYQVLDGRTQSRNLLTERLQGLVINNERAGPMRALDIVPEHGDMFADLSTDGDLQVWSGGSRIQVPLGQPVSEPLAGPCTHVRLEQSDWYPGRTVVVMGHPAGYTGYLVADGKLRALETGERPL